MTTTAPGHTEGPGTSLAEKLRLLRDLHRRPDGAEYTQQEIAAGVTALFWADKAVELRDRLTHSHATESEVQAGMEKFEQEKRPLVTRAYISQLLSGGGGNPTVEKLTYLAGFFKVPVGYFFDDEGAAQVAAEVEELKELRDLLTTREEREDVLALARSAAGLPQRTRKFILQAALQQVEEMQRLTAQEGDNQ